MTHPENANAACNEIAAIAARMQMVPRDFLEAARLVGGAGIALPSDRLPTGREILDAYLSGEPSAIPVLREFMLEIEGASPNAAFDRALQDFKRRLERVQRQEKQRVNMRDVREGL